MTNFNWAGRPWYYEFRQLPKQFDENDAKSFQHALSQRYTKLAKSWNADLNSEWICRQFLAAKSIMTSTLLINNMHYAEQHNIRATSPYLAYYSTFTLLKGLLYMNPEHKWDAGRLLETTHSKTINVGCAVLNGLDITFGNEMKEKILRLKASRELLSYRMPSSGDLLFTAERDLMDVCELLADLIQLHSELLWYSLLKHANSKHFVFEADCALPLYKVEIEGEVFVDREDFHRLHYLMRHPEPTNVWFIMREGWVEDFFGAWCSDDGSGFNPDKDWNMIFAIP